MLAIRVAIRAFKNGVVSSVDDEVAIKELKRGGIRLYL
jgi:hypothetical protein